MARAHGEVHGARRAPRKRPAARAQPQGLERILRSNSPDRACGHRHPTDRWQPRAFDQAQLDAWVDRYLGKIERPKTPIQRVTVLTGAFGREIETTADLASWIAQLELRGVPTSQAMSYPSALAAVTPADVQAAIKRAKLSSEGTTVLICSSSVRRRAFYRSYASSIEMRR